MPKFATYFHVETTETTKPPHEIEFAGHSYPYFSQIRAELAKAMPHYPSIPLRKADYVDFAPVHDAIYLDQLQRMSHDEPVAKLPRLSIECQGLAYTIPGILFGLGGLMSAIDEMQAGRLERAYGFNQLGHHSHPDWGHGYCILNPQAAATRYAQSRGFDQVLIVDWDIHHGDGTQTIFANDPSVYHISIHSAADLYMGLQKVLRLGTTAVAEQLGHCNIPILHKLYPDDVFEKLSFEGNFYRGEDSKSVFQDALDNLPWPPDLIFIFSGYDSHKDDQGADITDWDNDDYADLTRMVLAVAEKAHCPVISSHGGGYTLEVAIQAAVSHIEVLAKE